uniref:Latartoxin-1b n=1 Tax=Lachesana tarabaevi TaxID=379576 RepID=LTX1B_LACTA|nr:RecName: Full=Latartoxin-1b; Short=LtTx-1b; Flags: Precursor [Lachesana tarabaevi]AFX65328.1 precursor toxin Tx 1b [Lachesana tarabaevi]
MKILVLAVVCTVLLQVALSADSEEVRDCIPTRHECTNNQQNCCEGHDCKCDYTEIGGAKKEICYCKKTLWQKTKDKLSTAGDILKS